MLFGWLATVVALVVASDPDLVLVFGLVPAAVALAIAAQRVATDGHADSVSVKSDDRSPGFKLPTTNLLPPIEALLGDPHSSLLERSHANMTACLNWRTAGPFVGSRVPVACLRRVFVMWTCV